MRRSTLIAIVCGAGIVGVALGRFGIDAGGWVVAAVLVATVAACRTRWFAYGLILLALLFGLWRTGVYRHELTRLTGRIGQPVEMAGTIVDDPALNDKGYVEFRLGRLRDESGAPLPGELTVRVFRTNLHRGWQLSVNGKLKDGFGTVPAELFYPKFEVISTQQDWLERFRQRFFTGVRTAVPESAASFGLGLLVGVRGLVPKDLQAQLNLVGLSHLVAVSGYNLTIIVAASHRLFRRFGKGAAMASSLWLIGGFLLVTGASASIVRASIVAVLALLAAHYGRSFRPLNLILLAAAATALVRPTYLTDLGWLLSFIGFFAVMVAAPAVTARLGEPRLVLVRLFIESSVAHVLTLPLLLYFFAQLSVVAPVTNLIVLPFVPLAMLSGFIAGLAGMIVPAFSGWFSWPATLILQSMLGVVDWFARQPWAGTATHITLPMMIGSYVVLMLGLVLLKRANRRAGRTEGGVDVLDGGTLGVGRG